jgi:hypothetical protein
MARYVSCERGANGPQSLLLSASPIVSVRPEATDARNKWPPNGWIVRLPSDDCQASNALTFVQGRIQQVRRAPSAVYEVMTNVLVKFLAQQPVLLVQTRILFAQAGVLSLQRSDTRTQPCDFLEQRGVGHATLTGRQTDCSKSREKSVTVDTNRLWCVLPVRESGR